MAITPDEVCNRLSRIGASNTLAAFCIRVDWAARIMSGLSYDEFRALDDEERDAWVQKAAEESGYDELCRTHTQTPKFAVITGVVVE